MRADIQREGVREIHRCRREFDKLKRAILPGDTIVVTKLDRLARSSRDLHNILGDLASAGCGFTSLGEAWCDTTTDVGRLMLTIMGGIAEFERGLIRKRCEEGIERAKAKGTRFGAPLPLTRANAAASVIKSERYTIVANRS